MVLGIGTDILKISHISYSTSSLDDPFVRRTFTDKEIDLALKQEIPLNYFAAGFAGKEAVFKSLSIHGDCIRLNEIEILEDEYGRPVVSLLGRAKAIAGQKGITMIHLSLSYDSDYATAFAVAINDPV
jgi:phosphopantetheine--protein transferase-like protein